LGLGKPDGKVKPDGRGGREKPDGTPLKPPAGRVGEAPLGGKPFGGRVGDAGFGAAFGNSSPSSSGPWAATKTLRAATKKSESFIFKVMSKERG